MTVTEFYSERGDSTFYDCYSLGEIHFNPTIPPTIISATAFTILTDCKIYVPVGSLEAYKSAANYPDPSTHAYIEE